VKLPDTILGSHFEASFVRGAVVRFLMQDPDDPSIDQRYKYAVLLNLDCQEDESILFLTTSKVEKLEVLRQRDPQAVHGLAVGSYPWVTLPTAIPLRQPKMYRRDELLAGLKAATFRFEGTLSTQDLKHIDEKLRQSRLIERKVLKRIVSL
jgi:hypothetical protein